MRLLNIVKDDERKTYLEPQLFSKKRSMVDV